MNSIEKRAADKLVRDYSDRNPVIDDPLPDLPPAVVKALGRLNQVLEQVAIEGGADVRYTVTTRYLYHSRGTREIPEITVEYENNGPTVERIKLEAQQRKYDRGVKLDQLVRDIWAGKVTFEQLDARMKEMVQ